MLDASIEVRFQRAKFLARYSGMSFGEFKAQEDAQLKGTAEYSQQLGRVFELADFKLINDFKSLDELKVAVFGVLKGWGWC